ncbi:hypothetical protein [Bacteroides finegoldii]|uniref:hypothetical protein n=1 Tax=Bacteroides finegoldii TaxID=338188 RepID=UPI00189FDDF4|nr:hypothetical protein [Bacteroides finegoldii]
MLKIILFCLCMAACNDKENEYSVILPEQEQESDVPQNYTELMNKTVNVPTIYEQEAEYRGNIVQIDYDTRDYVAGTGETRINTAYVYLPYGYDETSDQPYNVFYFVHGHGETAASFFSK